MKKILFSLFVLLSIAGCNRKQSSTIGKNENDLIPGQYIVFMKDSYAVPILDGRDTSNKRIDKDGAKRAKIDSMLRSFLRGKGIADTAMTVFSDLKVMALVRTSESIAEVLKGDTIHVMDVIQDIAVQINPIQQTNPAERDDPQRQWLSRIVPEINPIQQSEPLQALYEFNPTNNVSKAIITAGGYTNGIGTSRVIWFLDTGIDLDNLYLNVDPSYGATFVGGGLDDEFGHGTFCAGVAAGKAIGVDNPDSLHIGVSEGATVIPVKVLDGEGKGTLGTVIAGLNHVVRYTMPGDVVNISVGIYDASKPDCNYPQMQRLLEKVTTIGGSKQVYLTISAGNESGNAMYNMPGCISGINIFTSSAINNDSTCAVYSNFGDPPVDFVSVGTRVFSLWKDGTFRLASGTSVSSAILAGIIHAKGSKPTSTFPVTCNGKPYIIANRH